MAFAAASDTIRPETKFDVTFCASLEAAGTFAADNAPLVTNISIALSAALIPALYKKTFQFPTNGSSFPPVAAILSETVCRMLFVTAPTLCASEYGLSSLPVATFITSSTTLAAPAIPRAGAAATVPMLDRTGCSSAIFSESFNAASCFLPSRSISIVSKNLFASFFPFTANK